MSSTRQRAFAAGLLLVALVACSPPSPDALLAEASAALERGEALTAKAALTNLLERSPDHVEALVLLGGVQLILGEGMGAERSLRRALELGAQPAALQIPLLQALREQGKFDELLQQASVGPVLSGSDSAALLSLTALAQRELGSMEEAAVAYRRAIEIAPKSAEYRTELAAILLAIGQVAEATQIVEAVNEERPDYAPALATRAAIEAAASRYTGAEDWATKALAAGKSGQRDTMVLATALLVEAQLGQHKIDSAADNAERLVTLVPRSAEALYLQARVDLARGDLGAAAQRLEGIIAATSDYRPAYVLLGFIKTKQQLFEQAQLYLQHAVNTDPSDARAQLLLAEVYIRRDDVTKAREAVENAAAEADGLVLALAGRASLEVGRPELANEYFERSERSAPKTARALIEIVNVYLATGQIERASRMLEAASFDEPDTREVATYALAFVQMRRGNFREAETTVARLPQRAAELNLRGTIALLGGEPARARSLYREALQEDPRYVQALLNLGRVAVAEKNLDAAADYLRQVVAIDDTQVNALLGLAQLAAARGDFAEASTWLARAPESVLTFRVGGDVLAAAKNFREAADAYASAFALRPSADLALRTYGAASRAGRTDADSALLAWIADHPDDVDVNFELGALATQRGRSGESIAYYERVLAKRPDHAAALNNLALLHAERGDDRALPLAERAHALRPGDPSIADTLGWLRVEQGDAAAGLPLLQQAAEALPNSMPVRYHLAVALARTGETTRARAELEKLLSEGGPFESRRDAERQLEALSIPTSLR